MIVDSSWVDYVISIEIGRLADPGLAADVRYRNPLIALSSIPPAEGIRQRKTLTKNGPVCRPQITSRTTLLSERYAVRLFGRRN